MISERIKSDIENATVKILKEDSRGDFVEGCQGVLVGGNLILTATHCVDYKITGMMLGDFYYERIRNKQGKILGVAPVAIEPLNDIAVLGSLDDQEFDDEVEEFEQFCNETKAVPLCLKEFDSNQTFPIHIYTHRDQWMTGTATQIKKKRPVLVIETDERIESGTSGSPVVNDQGELVGIISYSSGSPSDKSVGSIPRPNLALPVWVLDTILHS